MPEGERHKSPGFQFHDARVNVAQLATAASREYSDQDPDTWASEVFAGLDEESQQDGSWHAALEQKLRNAVGKIMACRVRT